MKRRHFNTEVTGDKKASLEWMRINAERERLYRFKSIAKDMATAYYMIMDRFTSLLISSQKSNKRGDLENSGSQEFAASGSGIGETSKDKDQASVSKDQASRANTNMGKQSNAPDFKKAMNAAYRENQLHNMIRFMCDYLRQVVENGSKFTAGHFFIMLLQFSESEILNNSADYIRVLVQELGIPRDQFQRFIAGLRDESLREAFATVEPQLYA